MSLLWIDIPGNDLKEILVAREAGDGLLQILEIPFISSQVNYGDMVRGVQFLGRQYPNDHEFVEVVKPGGFTTLHTTFAKEVALAEKKDIVRKLLEMGVVHRRYELTAFTFSVPPGPIGERAMRFLDSLIAKKRVCYDDHKESGVLSNINAMFGYMENPPRLNNGLADDPELDYYPSRFVMNPSTFY